MINPMSSRLLAFICIMAATSAPNGHVLAQGPPAPTAQKEAMAKLAYWVGTWKGKGSVILGPGQSRDTNVTEKIESKLDGLVLQIEGIGVSKGADGKEAVTHNALGMVWYDVEKKVYRMRTFVLQGYTMETEVKLTSDGYEWGFKAGENGPTMKYTIHNKDGKWNEVGEMSFDGKTWRKNFEMNLEKQKP